MQDATKTPTVEELLQQLNQLQQEIQCEIDAYDERAAIQAVEREKGWTRHCIEGLQRPERFPGERYCLWLHLKETKSHAGIFKAVAK